MIKSKRISTLAKTVNQYHKSSITFSQMQKWVGHDTTVAELAELVVEVEMSKGAQGVTPQDIMDLVE